MGGMLEVRGGIRLVVRGGIATGSGILTVGGLRLDVRGGRGRPLMVVLVAWDAIGATNMRPSASATVVEPFISISFTVEGYGVVSTWF